MEKNIQKTLDRIEKLYGEGSIVTGSEARQKPDVISTGSVGLDRATGVGGLPRGAIVDLRGWQSCLSDSVHLKYIVVDPVSGRVQNSKGGTIKQLYEYFNNPSKRSDSTKASEVYVMGMNEKNRIIRNPISEVVSTGRKECFRLTSKGGFSIEATSDHKFFVGTQYKALSELKVGDIVFVHNNTQKQGRNKVDRHFEVHLKWYYKNSRKIGNSVYYRADRHRLVYEAYMNGVEYEDYIRLLNSGTKELPPLWWTIPEGMHVHHIDENCRNDEPSNLELIDPSSHGKLHASARQDNLRFVAVADYVKEITPIGIRDTYDVKCFYPYNNFVADGFVVHNSGKSTISLNVIANAQKIGVRCLLVDGENSFDIKYAKALGVNVDELLITQMDEKGAEKCYNIAEEALRSGEIGVIVFDSQTSLIPKKMIEDPVGTASMALQARMMSSSLPKFVTLAAQNNCLIIYITQYREKPGVMYGSPLTPTGGNALKFYAHMIIEVSKQVQMEDKVAHHNKTKCKVSKNKVAVPFKEAEFDIIFGVGIDTVKEIIEVGADLGVVTLKGSWYGYNGDKLGQGADSAAQLLRDHPELLEEIRIKVLNSNSQTTAKVEKEG